MVFILAWSPATLAMTVALARDGGLGGFLAPSPRSCSRATW